MPATWPATYRHRVQSATRFAGRVIHTDREIADLQQRAAHLRGITDDPLAPPIRHAREQHELHRLTAIVTAHKTARRP